MTIKALARSSTWHPRLKALTVVFLAVRFLASTALVLDTLFGAALYRLNIRHILAVSALAKVVTWLTELVTLAIIFFAVGLFTVTKHNFILLFIKVLFYWDTLSLWGVFRGLRVVEVMLILDKDIENMIFIFQNGAIRI